MKGSFFTIRKILLISFAVLPSAVILQAQKTSFHDLSWVGQYIGKTSSDLTGDNRFLPSLRMALPAMAPLPNTKSTSQAAGEFMAQGQGALQSLGSSIVANGCLPGACNVAGGWIWISTEAQQNQKSPIMLALLQPHAGAPASQLPFTLILVGKGARPDLAMPMAARQSLAAWVKTMKAVNIVDFQIENEEGKHKAKLPDYLHVTQ